MEVVVEFIAALVTSLAVAIFAQFGVDLSASGESARPEVHRTVEREPAAEQATFKAAHTGEC